MPWKEADAVELRTEFVSRALREDLPFVALCREYGISPKTGYKWKQRFLARGLNGLLDLSRRPHACPAAADEDTICELIRLKGAHPRWGPKKIRELYLRAHPLNPAPSLSTVQRLLGKAGLVERRRKRRRPEDCGRLSNPLVATVPNQVWSVDFKGWWYTPCGNRVLPLTVRDAFSRYMLLVQVVADASADTVKECFARLFQKYGLPLAIRSDNGSPFACTRAPLGLTRLAAWWVSLGISLDRIQPGRPAENGGHERMHREIALEVEGRVDGGLVEQQAALDLWQQEYNCERPHEALGMRTPAELYRRSERRFDPHQPELQYPLEYWRRRVRPDGCINLARRQILITAAVSGWEVGLQPQPSRKFNVWFGPLCLGQLHLREEKFIAHGAKCDT